MAQNGNALWVTAKKLGTVEEPFFGRIPGPDSGGRENITFSHFLQNFARPSAPADIVQPGASTFFVVSSQSGIWDSTIYFLAGH